MKICMFTNTYAPGVGGIERSIDIFAEQMRREGHRVVVVAPEYDGATESTEDVWRVPAIKGIAGSPYSIKLAVPASIDRRLEQLQPDIIHSHQPFLLGDSALRVARSLGAPVVYTNHTFMERYLHWFPVDWQILRDIAEKLPVAYSNLVDYVIAPTQSVAEILRQRGAKAPMSVIPTGIDAAFYGAGNGAAFRARWNIPAEAFVLGHLGRLNPEKNLDYLAQVALAFVQQQPDNRVFLLVGQGESVGPMQQLFESMGAAHHLVYAGLQTGQDSADAYAAMDAFLFTSLSDTQGLVLSEAMAAGNPVFALHATGARDMVKHGETGFLYPEDTPAEAFADNIDQVVRDPQRYQQLRRAAVAAARSVSIPACTEAMLALYAEVIDRYRSERMELSSWEKLVNRWEVEIELVQEKLDCLW